MKMKKMAFSKSKTKESKNAEKFQKKTGCSPLGSYSVYFRMHDGWNARHTGGSQGRAVCESQDVLEDTERKRNKQNDAEK